MPWNDVQMINLVAAMNQCDLIGVGPFRSIHGAFREAKDLHMYLGTRGPFEARPLLAAAYANLVPDGVHIGPSAFKDDDAHEFLIQRFGFRSESIR